MILTVKTTYTESVIEHILNTDGVFAILMGESEEEITQYCKNNVNTNEKSKKDKKDNKIIKLPCKYLNDSFLRTLDDQTVLLFDFSDLDHSGQKRVSNLIKNITRSRNGEKKKRIIFASVNNEHEKLLELNPDLQGRFMLLNIEKVVKS